MLERSSVRDSTPKPWKLRLILKTRTTRTRRRTERKPSSAVAPAAITTRSTYHGRIATRSMRLSVCSTKARRRIATEHSRKRSAYSTVNVMMQNASIVSAPIAMPSRAPGPPQRRWSPGANGSRDA